MVCVFTFHLAGDDPGVATLSGWPWLHDSGASQEGCVSVERSRRGGLITLGKLFLREKAF